ncbi:MAG: tRNA pseudouridine(13) synthase TruD [bacterium]|nr:tRNA pseudouridine(13) synthase TruD [bacterium]
MPRIRAQPEDFIVEEIPLYPHLGNGPHTYLLVEKRLCTTDAVARTLARAAGVTPREVGFAGRKDRVAVARQWFSIPDFDPARARELELSGAQVLKTVRHPEKLRVGQLMGNRFQMVVREVGDEAAGQAEETLRTLMRRGMPNRFGNQRFGWEGANVARGAEILRSQRVSGDRRHALLMLSALQSAVFNRVLARRSASVDRLLPGDVAFFHDTGIQFLVEDPEAEATRVATFEISPTGPIFGTKMKVPRGEVAALENEVMAEFDLPGLQKLTVPRGVRLHGGRRALRVQPKGVRSEWADGTFQLEFELPAGSYATVLLEELFPDDLVDEALRRTAASSPAAELSGIEKLEETD